MVSYILDNVTVQHPNYSDGADPNLPSNEVAWNYVLFSYTGLLNNGQHQLKATIDACGNQTFYVDYAVVHNELSSNDTTGSSSESRPGLITGATKVGVVVGSVLGFLVLLMLGVVTLLFRKRRKTRLEKIFTPSRK